MRKNNISEMELLEVTWQKPLYSPKPSFIPKYYSHKLLGRKGSFHWNPEVDILWSVCAIHKSMTPLPFYGKYVPL